MTWLKHCISALLLALAAGCASAPQSIPQSAKSPPAVPAALSRGFDVAVGHLQAQRFEQAEAALKPLSVAYPEQVAVWTNLGIAYAGQGRNEDAVLALEEALRLQPRHPVAGNRLAILHREAGRFELARQHYDAVLAAHPAHAPAHLNLGILCDLYLADLSCAQRHYQRYLALEGDDARVSNWLLDLERRLPESE